MNGIDAHPPAMQPEPEAPKHEFWESTRKSKLYKNLGDNIKQQIEAEVLDWLQKDDGPTHSVTFHNEAGILVDQTMFVRSVINLRTGANTWDVWQIATSSDWPHILSYKVKSIGSNTADDDFNLPNDVKSCIWKSVK